MRMKLLFSFLVCTILLYSCADEPVIADEGNSVITPDTSTVQETPEYYTLPAYSPSGNVHAVIEIPAGTNHKIEYDHDNNSFPVDQKYGQDRVIDFLPYPGNYGFIPSSYMDPKRGGDGDALDILVLSESVETATVMEVVPIAIIGLMDGGEIDNKIVAIPADESLRIIDAATYEELARDYPAVLTMIQNWFVNYKGPGEMEFRGWSNGEAAMADIRKWVDGYVEPLEPDAE